MIRLPYKGIVLCPVGHVLSEPKENRIRKRLFSFLLYI